MSAVNIIRRLIAITKELQVAAEGEDYHRLSPLLSMRQELMDQMDTRNEAITEELLELLEVLKMEDDRATIIMQNQKQMLVTERLNRMGRERQIRRSYFHTGSTPSRFEAMQ